MSLDKLEKRDMILNDNLFLFNYDCINEAIINALVHNDWTITEPQISMFHTD